MSPAASENSPSVLLMLCRLSSTTLRKLAVTPGALLVAASIFA